MVTDRDITAIQACIANPLNRVVIGKRRLAGVIGDAPSHYSKSPAIWNAAFHRLGIDAVYLPFDVAESRLKDFTSVLRDSDRALGINVTVPHKLKVMEYLDELDAGAARIKAVNTIARSADGRLVGYNTDGRGFVESLLHPAPGQTRGFIDSLKGASVLLLGAGGSARAVAFHVADLLDNGQLLICNRTVEHARDLAAEITKPGGNARAIGEAELCQWASKVSLIINSTTKGQGGVRKLPNGMVTTLEPYSSLAPAAPRACAAPAAVTKELHRRWAEANRADIDANNQASRNLAQSIPQGVAFYDLIYHPEETVFLRQGRLTGHRTMNGRGMIVWQAALAFFHHICNAELRSRKLDTPETLKRIADIMQQAW